MKPAKALAKTWGLVVALGIFVGLVVGVVQIVDMRNETASLRTQYEILKSKNEHLFSLLVTLIKEGTLSLDELRPLISTAKASEITEQASYSRREQLPFALDSKFYPSGWMGDGMFGKKYVKYRYRQSTIDEREVTVIEITYRKGPEGWAGIYWQFPDNNWGDKPGRNLIGAHAITFLAKGEYGGEIVEFKSGGIRGEYKDSYETSLEKVILTNTWSRHSINLSKFDLSSVIGAFSWVVSADGMESGEITTYIADLKIE